MHTTREHLHSLVEQLPEERLEAAAAALVALEDKGLTAEDAEAIEGADSEALVDGATFAAKLRALVR